MPGFGYGYWSGRSRRTVFALNGVTVPEAVVQHDVAFQFASPRPAGQYANGDWWVLGPVSIASISPESTTHDGTDGNGNPYTGRVAHGAMLNPGNRSFATGGLTANNTTNTVQSFDTLADGVSGMTYNATHNIDPGATGSPAEVTTGSVVKFVSKLTGLPVNDRPAGLDMVVLTVVDSIPETDAIRPGVSRASKASLIRSSQFDLSVFQNLAPTASAPTYEQALDWVDRYIEAAYPDSINNTGAKGINNHPEYGRDIGNNLHRAMLCLHLSSFTADQKRALLCRLAAIADDFVARAEEGAVTLAAGGGNQFKKAVIVLCGAALGDSIPASWATWLSNANRNVWGEDAQIFRVDGFDIAEPRYTADGRPRSAYTYQMLGSAEWGEQPLVLTNRNGSNWNATYRDVVGGQLLGGMLAVELTTGGKALWDHDDLFLYMKTAFLRRAEFGAGNGTVAFVEEMLLAYRPTEAAAPAIVEAGTKSDEVWIRFDQALNETATAPATSDFVVSVNGSPVTISSVSVWRQNIGLELAAALSGNDTVTVSYTSGANPVSSVDGVNVASFSGQAVTNTNDKVGGPNAAYPVVRFAPGVVRTIGGTSKVAAANSLVGTIALLKFKINALPAADARIIGSASGAPGLQLFLKTTGALELRVRGVTSSVANRPTTGPLSVGVEYDVLFSLDNAQATAAAGANCYINGAAQTLSNFNFVSGQSLAWANAAVYAVNPNGADFSLGALWFDPTTRVDLTNSANRDKFTSLTSGDLDILTLGDGITGTQPPLFLVGDADQWNDGAGMNRGTADKFFVTSGAVTLVSGGEWV